ncbi:hypothetical protein B0O80DRAFT_443131 [Mortierella sp. GBAus27b]|nr:hypothetical protein B0O80DRAFT_443131 [Mortierella sp. GBAus27b]
MASMWRGRFLIACVSSLTLRPLRSITLKHFPFPLRCFLLPKLPCHGQQIIDTTGTSKDRMLLEQDVAGTGAEISFDMSWVHLSGRSQE